MEPTPKNIKAARILPKAVARYNRRRKLFNENFVGSHWRNEPNWLLLLEQAGQTMRNVKKRSLPTPSWYNEVQATIKQNRANRKAGR